MPVTETTLTSINPELDRFKNSIQKCRDFSNGEDAVKSSDKAELYLPMLPGQRKDPVYGPDDYLTYKEYATLFPAVARTEESYTGIAFRKTPIVKTQDEKYTEDFTYGGQSITEFAKELFDEVLETYRPGILVDVPATDVDILEGTVGFVSRRQAEDVQRPFAALYTAENILDWDEQRINGKLTTTYVKLYEIERVPDPNSLSSEFDYDTVERIRVLDLDEDGYYRHRIYEKQDETSQDIQSLKRESPLLFTGSYMFVGEVYPQMGGQKMQEIPFFPASPRGHEWALNFPPLNDLANINMAHYRNSASYENGLLLAGSPTACLGGLDPNFIQDGAVKLGAGSVLLFNGENPFAQFLQIGSEGLAEIKRAMEDKKKEMATVGARILSGDPAGVEAAETAMIHRAGEHSVIMNIAGSISSVLTDVLRFMYLWDTGSEADTEDMLFALNIDFDFSKLDPQMLTALMGAVQTGRMSTDTFYYNLERGEMYPPNWSKEIETEGIESDREAMSEEEPFLAEEEQTVVEEEE